VWWRLLDLILLGFWSSCRQSIDHLVGPGSVKIVLQLVRYSPGRKRRRW
jgi:hypothetical protein